MQDLPRRIADLPGCVGCLSTCGTTLVSHSAPRGRLKAARKHEGQRPPAIPPEQPLGRVPVQ